ncbi:MAG: dihydrolipoamide acetyltransferase family protein [Terracidiphilus sp.]|jgi:2-oxoglutarate dehydrogenase E2 component (dihydrolipoamide succinyltransferase)
MPTEVIMPQMGESIFEGTITKWLKKVGDQVEKDEPLFEISTDKVDAEIPSPEAGVLTEIRIGEGATVEVNTVVAVIGEAGSAVAAPAAALVPGSPTQEAAALQVPPPQVASLHAAQAPGRIRSSPLARRVAEEYGIDLSRISGTGAGGRIGKEDVLRAAQSPFQKAAAPSSSAQPSVQKAAALQVPPPQVVPLTRMRAIIADRMVESVRTSPHVYTVYRVDMTRIVRLREQQRADFEQRHGTKLTYMPFIAAAAVAALRRYPIVNASLVKKASLENVAAQESAANAESAGLAIRYHRNINLGIAVALEWGLIVPVVREAEQQTFVALARTIADLALRARTKKLLPDEVGGSSFTLTNAGAFGGEFGMPIINQPESAILAVGGLRKEPAVLTDADGNDSIAIRSMQYFCLGFDHRLIDGADAGKFMLEFKKTLEYWDQEIG